MSSETIVSVPAASRAIEEWTYLYAALVFAPVRLTLTSLVVLAFAFGL